jgi:hypothetical protein
MSAIHLLPADRKRFAAIKLINEYLFLIRVKIEIHGLLVSLFARLYYSPAKVPVSIVIAWS